MAGLFQTLANEDATYLESAAESAARAAQSAVDAAASADDAAASAGQAAASVNQIGNSVQRAETAATRAETAVTTTSANATAAQASATAAANSASTANIAADRAEAAASDMTDQIQEAKDWANKTTGTVDGTEYSSKYYAQQSAASAAQTGSVIQQSKDWATKTTGTVDGTEYSSKYYSQQAKSSQSAASASAAQASGSVTQAAQYASNASASATQSSNSATTSATQANNAAGSASAAQASATSAASQVGLAANQVTLAANQVTLATTQANLAKDWAIKEGSTVDGSGYSAKYWAGRAQEIVGGPYVLRGGDTMTGNLTIDAASPVLSVGGSSSGTLPAISKILVGSSVYGQTTMTKTFSPSSSSFEIASNLSSSYINSYKQDTTTGHVWTLGGSIIGTTYTMSLGVNGLLTLPNDISSPLFSGSLKSYIDNRAIDAYTKAQSDSRYMQITNAYTKTEADSRYVQVSGTNYVPSTRTVNGKALSSNVTLSSTDIGAVASSAGTATNLSVTQTTNFIGGDTGVRTEVSNYSTGSGATGVWSVKPINGTGVSGTYLFASNGLATFPGDISSPTFSGSLKSYIDNKSSAYVLPTASSTVLGGVKIGTGLSINSSTGVLSLPTASSTVLGGVKVGSGLNIDSSTGVLSATGAVSSVNGKSGVVVLTADDISGAAKLSGNNTFIDSTLTFTQSSNQYSSSSITTDGYGSPTSTVSEMQFDVTGTQSTNTRKYTMKLNTIEGLSLWDNKSVINAKTDIQSNFTETNSTTHEGTTDFLISVSDVVDVSGSLGTRSYNYRFSKGDISIPALDGSLKAYIDSHSGGGGSYVLPIAKNDTLGGIKVGSGLSIDASTGILSVNSSGAGIPTGGTTGQVLGKASNTDGDVQWIDVTGGSAAVSSVNGKTGTVTLIASDINAYTKEETDAAIAAGGGGTGDVSAAGNNAFTGNNTFTLAENGKFEIKSFDNITNTTMQLFGDNSGMQLQLFGNNSNLVMGAYGDNSYVNIYGTNFSVENNKTYVSGNEISSIDTDGNISTTSRSLGIENTAGETSGLQNWNTRHSIKTIFTGKNDPSTGLSGTTKMVFTVNGANNDDDELGIFNLTSKGIVEVPTDISVGTITSLVAKIADLEARIAALEAAANP